MISNIPRFALRFSDSLISSYSYEANAGNQVVYKGQEFTDTRFKVDHSSTALTGRRTQTTKWVYNDYNVVISTKEINDECLFLKSFWEAKYSFIAVYNSETEIWGDYEQINTPSGEFPREFVNNIKMFPKVTLQLKGVMPSA